MECLQQLLEALEPVVVAAAGDFSQSYEGFSTDTRTVKAGNVFVALSGERFDGHDFVVGEMCIRDSARQRPVQGAHALRGA